MDSKQEIGGPIICNYCGSAYNYNDLHVCNQAERIASLEAALKETKAIAGEPALIIHQLESQLTSAREQIEALKHDLAVVEESLEAQIKKYEDCPHPKPLDAYDKPTACACSYDRASDVCAVHAPQLKAAKQQIAALEAQLAAVTGKVTDGNE